MSTATRLNKAELLARFREISQLESVLSLLGWDMESMMPAGGVDLRGRQIAQLTAMKHRLETEPAFVEAALAFDEPGHGDRLKRATLRNICVDEAFVSKLASAQVRCQEKWKSARKARDFSQVRNDLAELIALTREWSERLKAHPATPAAMKTLTPFEVLLDTYEPGLRASTLESWLGTLGPELATRIPKYVAKQSKAPAVPAEVIAMPLAEQRALVRKVAEGLGFEFSRGRLDDSTHPFCGGSPEDTRMTVRYFENDFTNAVSSTTHESGHAIYEQTLPRDLLHMPAGIAASYGVHESQSRFLENQIGRSLPFCQWLGSLTKRDPNQLFAHMNRVKPSLIRVDADEATYNLHILVRFDIEKKLINGETTVDDVPRLWNEGYKKFLGIDVPQDGDGCLQDIHWYGGAFGYFATYTIGNLLAAALFADFEKAHPAWGEKVARGDFSEVRAFVGERVHRHAALRDSPGTIRHALGGRELTIEPFLAYLDRKFLAG